MGVVSAIGQVEGIERPLSVELRNTPALVGALGADLEAEAKDEPAWSRIQIVGFAGRAIRGIAMQSAAELAAERQLTTYWFMNHRDRDWEATDFESDAPSGPPDDAGDF